MNLETWFPTPIWNTVVDITDAQNQEAIDFCVNLRERTNGREVSNVGGWQSNDLLENDLLNTPLEFLIGAAKPICQKAIMDFGSSKQAAILNSWVNINDKNNYNKLHNHTSCDLACVFYLTGNNSDIEFVRPYDIQKYFLDNLESDYSTQLSFSHVTHSPTKNTLLVFPSWLQHCVKPNENNSTRISVAINIKAI